MSSNCLCSNGSRSKALLSASEYARQKANINLRVNDTILNCTPNPAPNDDAFSRRLYRGNQERLRSMNGFRILPVACNAGNTNCVTNKSSADYYVIN